MAFWDRVERATDWTVGLFSPRRRAVSQHFSRMKDDPDYREVFIAMMRTRGYRAARMGNNTPFLGSSGSADDEVLSDLPTLSSRAKELTRDDPLASGLRLTMERNVVGPGMRPQARTDSPEKNKQMEDFWGLRKDMLAPADDMTHGEWQSMVFGNAWESGNIFVKVARDLPRSPVWFETIEKERVATPPGMMGRTNIIDGVEKDGWGRPVAYWVVKAGKSGAAQSDFARVPKAAMRHLRLANRPGQTHGVPACHAILQDLRDLDLLILASLKRVQVAACLSVFLKTPKQIEDIMDVTAQTYGYKLDQSLEPGMIFKLFPDEEVMTVNPNYPTSEFEPFIILLCRRIGAALGVSWQVVLKDFSKSNYSSARTDLLETRQGYVIFQKWLIEKLLNWQWREVMLDGMMRGELRGVTEEDLDRVFWIPPGWRWVDPEKEAKATQIELDLGITTRQEICAGLGKDWEETLYQSLLEEKREKEMREELGLQEKPNPEKNPFEKEGEEETDEEAEEETDE